MDVGGGGDLMGRDSWNGAGWHGLTGGEAVEAVEGEGRWPGGLAGALAAVPSRSRG